MVTIKELKSLDALTADEDLTDLGTILAKLPVAPSMGKMILLGMLFECFGRLLAVVRSMLQTWDEADM